MDNTSLQRAGRQLDALIHERVMQRPVLWSHAGPHGQAPFDRLAQESLQRLNQEREQAGLVPLHDRGVHHDGDVPHYSTEVQAAWLLVKQMQPRRLLLRTDSDNRVRATFDEATGLDGPLAAEGVGEQLSSLALAICLAALQVVGQGSNGDTA